LLYAHIHTHTYTDTPPIWERGVKGKSGGIVLCMLICYVQVPFCRMPFDQHICTYMYNVWGRNNLLPQKQLVNIFIAIFFSHFPRVIFLLVKFLLWNLAHCWQILHCFYSLGNALLGILTWLKAERVLLHECVWILTSIYIYIWMYECMFVSSFGVFHLCLI